MQQRNFSNHCNRYNYANNKSCKYDPSELVTEG